MDTDSLRLIEFDSHEGINHKIYRFTDYDNSSYILKRSVDDTPLSLLALANEKQILERLQGVDGCPNLIDFKTNELKIEDFGGIPLSQSKLLGNVNTEEFLLIASKISRILASIHAHGIIHKDINPANILIRQNDLNIQIIDFDLSTTFVQERSEFQHLSHLLGTYHYLSPEQTGRMNRTLDYRSDLYSLGASLYALAFGKPPFEENDSISLIHAHLTNLPIPLHEHLEWVPLPISEIIMRLLAKEPDERYQSAAGVAYDFEQLLYAIKEGIPLNDVSLRERDLSMSLGVSSRLYGRDQERLQLLNTFNKAKIGSAKAIFISGYSGVGKTSLIHELYKPITLSHGIFISGKFDQYKRNRPFSAPIQAFKTLCQLLLNESVSVVASYKKTLQKALGTDAGALFELLPELEELIGKQLPVQTLGPLEAQRRFRSLLIILIRELSTAEHPIVLFLDDLQWADQASFDFINALVDENTLNSFLFIGAYRNNEVDLSHPLMSILQRGSNSIGAISDIIELSDLDPKNLTLLISDMLHTPSAKVESLASLIHAHTHGNPYYSIEFLNHLHRKGIIKPDIGQGLWTWDEQAILEENSSDNVINFLSVQLNKLSPKTLELLINCSALGSEFSLGLLACATGASRHELAESLRTALEYGILLTSDSLSFQQLHSDVTLRFCHDRMQQAIYNLQDETFHKKLHLQIARRFAKESSFENIHMMAAEHYAVSVSLVKEKNESKTVRKLFVDAAIQGRAVGAFESAEFYLHSAINLLDFDPWKLNFNETIGLYRELHIILYSLARYEEADAIYTLLSHNTESAVEMIDSASIQIVSYSNRLQYKDAVMLGRSLLQKLGMDIPERDLPHYLEEELTAFYGHVQAGAFQKLAHSDRMEDPNLLGIALLMNRMIPSSFFFDPVFVFILIVRTMRLWIEEGFSDAMLYPAGCMMVATVAGCNDYKTGYECCKIALEAGEYHQSNRLEMARLQLQFGLINNHWFKDASEDVNYGHTAFSGLLNGGDLEQACYTFFTTQGPLFDTCDNLSIIKNENDSASVFAEKTGNQHSLQMFTTFKQLIKALKGETNEPGSFNDDTFDEKSYQEQILHNGMASAYFHTYRAVLAAIFGDSGAHIYHIKHALPFAPHITSFYPTVLVNLFHSLALIQELRNVQEYTSSELWGQLNSNQQWLLARAEDAPMNFDHLYDFIEAQRLEIQGETAKCLALYEQAMQKAQGSQRAWHHAFIAEYAGMCYVRHGLEYAGRALLTLAYTLYVKWGAIGKAKSMNKALLFLDSLDILNQQNISIDTEVILRASNALSSETSLSGLVNRLLELLAQLSGATHTRFLLLNENNEWMIEGGFNNNQKLTSLSLDKAIDQRIIPVSLLNAMIRSKDIILSDDIVMDSRFMHDPYYAELSVCSLLTMPIFIQGRLIAFLILENRLYRSAFAAKQVEIISLLSSQLAISIENARLYHSLEEKVSERTHDLELLNRKLEIISITDGLTALPNRRHFDQVLDLEWKRAIRSKETIAIAMMDVDWFKTYNDYYGHQEGDICLQKIASVLTSKMKRATDLVARYGGEEFVIIATDINEENMVNLAQSIHEALFTLALPHEASAFHYVTMSIGLALIVPTTEIDPDSLLRFADKALYRAKRNGRNQTVIYSATDFI